MPGRDFWKRALAGASFAGLLALAPPAAVKAQEPPPRPFLRKVIQLDDGQLAAMEKGEVVTKMLPSAFRSIPLGPPCSRLCRPRR